MGLGIGCAGWTKPEDGRCNDKKKTASKEEPMEVERTIEHLVHWT